MKSLIFVFCASMALSTVSFAKAKGPSEKKSAPAEKELYFQATEFGEGGEQNAQLYAEEIFNALKTSDTQTEIRVGHPVEGDILGLECQKMQNGDRQDVSCQAYNLTREKPEGASIDDSLLGNVNMADGDTILGSELKFSGPISKIIYEALNVKEDVRIGAMVKQAGNLTCSRQPKIGKTLTRVYSCVLTEVAVASLETKHFPAEFRDAFEKAAKELGL